MYQTNFVLHSFSVSVNLLADFHYNFFFIPQILLWNSIKIPFKIKYLFLEWYLSISKSWIINDNKSLISRLFVFIIIYDIILVNSMRRELGSWSEYFLIPIHLILNPWLSIWKASHIEKGKGVNSKPSIYFNVLYNMDHCVCIRTTFIC